jgi:hypothetical protein
VPAFLVNLRGVGDLREVLRNDLGGGLRTFARVRQTRAAALNQSGTSDQFLRQAINEGRRSLFWQLPLIGFVCECPREGCYENVPLSAAEYDARRPGPITTDAHAAAS